MGKSQYRCLNSGPLLQTNEFRSSYDNIYPSPHTTLFASTLTPPPPHRERAARATANDYAAALGLARRKRSCWAPPVLRCSALRAEGISEVWEQARESKRRGVVGSWSSNAFVILKKLANEAFGL